MPRAPSPYWKCVTVLEEPDGKSRMQAVRCNYCFAKFFTSSATRIKQHMDNCDLARDLDEDIQTEVNTSSSVVDSFTAVATLSSSESNNMRMTSWVDSINSSTVRRLDALIGEAFFTGGIPFRFIENPALVKFIKTIRPSYELPNRHRLCNEILEETFTSVKSKMAVEIASAKYVSITTDAWTDINGQPVINVIVLTPKPIFLKAVYSKSNSHNAEYLTEITAAAIREIGAEKVVAVVTDNAAPNKLAWNNLEKTFRGLICIGCAAHWLNLLAKDILKISAFKEVVSQTIGMIKSFKNKHRLHCRLEEAQKSIYGVTFALETPVETRWMSHYNALKSFIKSKTALQRVVIGEDYSEICQGPKGADIKRLVLDDGYWANVTEVRAILEPVAAAILHLEGDKGALSAVQPNFVNIINFYESSSLPNKDAALSAAKDRWKEFLTPVVALVYLLDPMNIKQFGRDSAIMEMAEIFVRRYYDDELALNLIRSLWSYVNRVDGFTEGAFLIANADLSAHVWWAECRCGPKHAALQSLAIRLLHAPATSATSERNWSAFRFIHSRLRNRLTEEQVEKLVHIFANSKLIDKNQQFDDMDLFTASLEASESLYDLFHRRLYCQNYLLKLLIHSKKQKKQGVLFCFKQSRFKHV